MAQPILEMGRGSKLIKSTCGASEYITLIEVRVPHNPLVG